MRRIVLAFLSTLAAVIMMFGYRTSTPSTASVATTTVAAADAGGDAATSSGTTSPAPQSTTGTATSSTVTGDVVETRWGPVQVQIVVSGGQITAAAAVQVPSENGRDVAINDRAVPVLTAETVSAQSAQIDSVSGATYTSDGYITSLQSAMDKAGL